MAKVDLEDGESLKKLKDVLHLLDPSKEYGTGKNRSGILEVLHKAVRRHSDYFHRSSPLAIRCSIHDMVPRFLELLRECLLSHQWDKALKVVEAMSQDLKSPGTTLWKVGVATLVQMGEAKSRLLQQFVKQVAALRELAVVQVLVEFLLHFLIKGDLSGARDLVGDLEKNTPYRVNLKDPQRQSAQTLFDAYQGLVQYVTWKQLIHQRDIDDSDDLPSAQKPVQSGDISSDPEEVAKTAIEALKPLANEEGVWDVFLPRVVEMMVHYGQVEEAWKLLSDYARHNPNNPNAHRYLYELAVSRGSDDHIREKYLRKVIELDPCNPLVIDLYYQLAEDDPSSVTLLFDFLDFDHCSDNLTVLTLLADKLDQLPTNMVAFIGSRLQTQVEQCWAVRSSWWPKTVLKEADCKRRNFSCDPATSQDDQDVVQVKRRIYEVLRNVKLKD